LTTAELAEQEINTQRKARYSKIEDSIILQRSPACLPIRMPECPHPRCSLSPKDSPELVQVPPASTAPPKLKEGRGKRKRKHTSRYKKAVKKGLLAASQHRAGGGGKATP